MKKILKFLIILLPWFLGSILFKVDKTFYKVLEKPFFAPKPIVFAVAWSILFILISISIYKVIDKSNIEYKKSLIINYFANEIFTFLFFTLKSPFLGFVDCILILISSLFLYLNTKSINKNASKLLIPYIIWNTYATILIATIFFMNL